MLSFTVLGFIAEGGRFLDVHLDVLADSPFDATEKALKQYSNLVVSNVCRASSGRFQDY